MAELLGASIGALTDLAEQVSPAILHVAAITGSGTEFWPGGSDRTGDRFHLGSVTKTFTALLLADLVVDGVIRLESTLDDYLETPAAVAGLTLLELATHTSGISHPRGVLAQGEGWRPEDPYGGVTMEVMEAALEASHLENRGSYAYSNFGYAVLGLALAAAVGTTYQQAVRERILTPLGLSDTTFDTETEERLLPGHDLTGQVVPHWHNPVMAGCASVLSTIHDGARYVEAQLHPEGTPLGDAILLGQRIHPLADAMVRGEELSGIGLAWRVSGRAPDPVYWHTSATSGFSSYVAFQPDREVGVVLLLAQRPGPDRELEAAGQTMLRRLTSAPRTQ